jgi:hypothetical protein
MPKPHGCGENASANIVIFSEIATILAQKKSIISYNCGKWMRFWLIFG